MKKTLVTASCDLTALYESCRRLAKSRGYCQSVVDEFPAYAVEQKLMGCGSDAPILLVNFLRKTFGIKGTMVHELKKATMVSEAGADATAALAAGDESIENVLVMRDMLGELPDRDAEIVRLHVIEGHTNREIGMRLSLTEARVCQILKAALRTLREAAG
jgi:hypothetical protein